MHLASQGKVASNKKRRYFYAKVVCKANSWGVYLGPYFEAVISCNRDLWTQNLLLNWKVCF